MEKEIVRVNRIIITQHKNQSGERKFALRYLLDPEDTQGVLVIQRLLTEERLREACSAFQKAVEYIESDVAK